MLLKHQRRYRRSLSELSRFNSRLLRDIGLAPPESPLERSENDLSTQTIRVLEAESVRDG
ncbi:DUF1127 domain-containing protein [Rhizobium bangladeshense]|uniref:DUF1127 domain-containing protein n=1 Tax=Rhizobium bangladeshense TaxID=1138189 RepID=UPI003CC96D17